MTCCPFFRKKKTSSDKQTIEGVEGTNFDNFILLFLHMVNLSGDKSPIIHCDLAHTFDQLISVQYRLYQCWLLGQEVLAVIFAALYHDMPKGFLNS